MTKNLTSLTLLLVFVATMTFGQTRNNDPVVVKGSNLSCMIGVQPSLIVAYKFNGTNLVQIPMQVDEVVVKEVSAPYNNLGCAAGTVSNNFSYDNISYYADVNTYTGADTDLLFDTDDELVFMVKDAGLKLTICPPTPTGVVNNTTCELELRDPINNALLGYVYLFQQNGTLNQGAGLNYVTYNFTYANNYQQTYDICAGGMTENSTVTTANYSMKFSKRVINDELKITAGGASNIDILDQHQFFVSPNACFRSEETFSDSRGTVVTSKNGHVRAIRSVMGANSGFATQWTMKFTESRVDYQLDFRVHPIGGFHDVMDLNPNAIGMMYYNDQNPNGVVINGVQDVLVTTNPNIWELYTGNQGSIVVGYDYQTDIPLGTNSIVQAYYDDGGSTNPKHICTGDGFAYGASGFNLATGLCTDYWATASGCGALASYFRLHRRNYLLPPSTTPTQAATYANYGNNPISTTQTVALLTSFCSSTNYNVTTSSNPVAGGTTTGSGTYASGTSVTVTASANSGYTFSNWTENGNVVSSNASYTFTISANRNLVANFNTLTSILNRPNDPVVLTGAQLSTFSALQPNQIVGFKFVNGTWTQIPIQVDEMALTDIVIPYGPSGNSLNLNPSPSNLHILAYSDPNTYTGSDPTTTFDSDDELVFMAKDAGGQSDGSTPQGVVMGSCREIMITDPLGGIGYVYLYQNGGSLQQDAGISYITYTTNLPSTAGFPAHGNGYNTENTSITTSKYNWHFSAEWVCDEYKLIVGNNTDILDRYKNFFANGNCQRHEDAFSAAENAFVTAKAGPIRAIRSVLGAVSGPLTQRTHVFYEGRQDISTDLRVHNIASIYDAFDYNSNANGMIYRNNLNTNGVTINGQQDVLTSGDIVWEQISGTPGTISILHRRTTTFATPTEALFTSYYDDNSTSPASNCTGDGQAWGTSGIGVIFYDPNQCTDPRHPCGTNPSLYRTLQSRRTVYTDPANGAATTASSYNNQFNNPLTVAIAATCTCIVPSSLTIIGSADVCQNGTMTYSVTAIEGTSYTWTVSGGTILSGQGTNQITVQWSSGTAGTVSVQQSAP